jgi:hypothetical protein
MENNDELEEEEKRKAPEKSFLSMNLARESYERARPTTSTTSSRVQDAAYRSRADQAPRAPRQGVQGNVREHAYLVRSKEDAQAFACREQQLIIGCMQ